MENNKQLLSEHVEGIFKKYTQPGLHICDLATGGGKSYTIGKLTCEYYPNFFDRIIILCVQNKLIDGMSREIDKFIDKEGALKSSDKIIIKRHYEVIREAVEKGYLKALMEDIEHNIDEQKRKGYACKDIFSKYNLARKSSNSVESLVKMLSDDKRDNIYFNEEIPQKESQLRDNIKNFFKAYRKHLQRTKQVKNVKVDYILKQFPYLEKVYPQVRCREKKVWLMTIHKAMYGIDPILSEDISLKDFAENKRKTLILFDESDQAAIAMRNVIIDRSLGDLREGRNKYAKGYQSFLQYKELIENYDGVSDSYYGSLLKESIQKAQNIIKTNWEKTFGSIIPYKNIFLGNDEEISDFRRGVFFSGNTFKLNFGDKEQKTRSYICFKKGEKHFRLVHHQNKEQLTQEYDHIVPLDKFLYLINGNQSAIKLQLRNVVKDALKRRKEDFESETDDKTQYLGYPTLEGEIHTLLSRFEKSSERLFENQLMDFITNRKNLSFKNGDKTIKLPDPSVYTQGIQLYQEEIDERDSLHRVMLTCREINDTPEKTIYDLVISGNASVVLCSATAASKSVISNFDIEYLQSALGDKVHFLSQEESSRFDDLVEKTLPMGRKCDVIPLAKYTYTEKRKEKITLPAEYQELFCKEAVEDGTVDKWFKATKAEMFKNTREKDDPTFHFYRIYQFIEAYHFFATHDDVHSMLYFQNRASSKDSVQMNVIASLVDGTYKQYLHDDDFEDGLPTHWKNDKLLATNKLEDVENALLPDLSNDKSAKKMLVTAYNSFKAGANLQYKIPEGLKCLKGDNWETNEDNLKKDWDAIYLQSPTSYITFSDDGMESTYEKKLYSLMLSLMMLYERSWLSKKDVAKWLVQAISTGDLYFHDDNVAMDKAAWAQTIVEQAVGRICRTKNKPATTYILYDESMSDFFLKENLKKSLTKEFKVLAGHILSREHQQEQCEISPLERKRCNDANRAQSLLNGMRKRALRYTPHPNEYADDLVDDEFENSGIPHIVESAQIMNHSYKQTIIRKPVIDSLEELEEKDRYFTSIEKCYGDWERNEHNEYYFSYKKEGNTVSIVPNKENGSTVCPQPVSPSSVRLDVLMKNSVIREHFERNGYATDWKPGKLILHPEILKSDYAGEIGEEAFKAIVLRYTNCTDDNFAHLTGKDYELADFVINNPDGSHKVAFDVKNMNPKIDHNDKEGDMPTNDKRKAKEKRLGCKVITVNMLEMPNGSIDANEICGVINAKGLILPDAIERIKHLIEK